MLPTRTTYERPPPTPEPDPVVEAVELKDPELTFPGEECNCYAFVENRVGDLPPMAAIIPNTEAAAGTVAVEWYGDIKHVSLVTAVTPDGVWVVEANYKHCETGERFIPYTKPSLYGFFMWV